MGHFCLGDCADMQSLTSHISMLACLTQYNERFRENKPRSHAGMLASGDWGSAATSCCLAGRAGSCPVPKYLPLGVAHGKQASSDCNRPLQHIIYHVLLTLAWQLDAAAVLGDLELETLEARSC